MGYVTVVTILTRQGIDTQVNITTHARTRILTPSIKRDYIHLAFCNRYALEKTIKGPDGAVVPKFSFAFTIAAFQSSKGIRNMAILIPNVKVGWKSVVVQSIGMVKLAIGYQFSGIMHHADIGKMPIRRVLAKNKPDEPCASTRRHKLQAVMIPSLD